MNAQRVAAAAAQQQDVGRPRAPATTSRPSSHHGSVKTPLTAPPPDQARLRASANRTTSAIQSRVGAQPQVRRARRGAAASATRSRCAAAAAANSRHSSGVVTHLALAPGLRVGEHDRADVGQLQLARVEHLDGEQLVARRQRAQRALPVGLAEEVGDDHGQAAPPRRAAQLLDRGGEVAAGAARARAAPARPGAAARARAPGRRGRGGAPVRSPVATTAPIRLPPPPVRWATAASAAIARSRFSHAAVPKSRLGDRSTSDPRLQLPVGDGLPHVRHGGAGGDRPVHPPHVVAGLVGPRLARLGARAGHQAEVVALQQPVEPDPHRQLERLAARPPAVRRAADGGAVVDRGAHGDAPPGAPPGPAAPAAGRVTCGSGTVGSTRATMWSTGTSSASAS